MHPARALALVVFLAAFPGGRPLPAQEGSKPKLWLALGVARPVFSVAEIATLQVSFAVVNDGDSVVDPEIGSSHLFINGVEPKDWNIVINNGLRSSDFTALPPGRLLSFGYQLGSRYFAKPGIYTVRWQVRNFRSADLIFRVMPAALNR